MLPSQGVTLNGNPVKNYQMGYSVAGLDINGDGLGDVVMSAYTANGLAVIFGGFDNVSYVNLDDLDGVNGFIVFNPNGINSEWNIARAGDVNSDGIDDLLIGSALTGVGGTSYILFGKTSFPASVQLNTYLTTSTGVELIGLSTDLNSGISVSGLGDVNGDGIDDFIIGGDDNGGDTADDRFADDDGENEGPGHAFVVYGRNSSNPFPLSISLESLDGSDGFIVNGRNNGDHFGHSVGSGGDFNGDGFMDIVIGAPSADPNGDENAGEVYIVYGFSNSSVSQLEADNVKNWGVKLDGTATSGHAGLAVGLAGDVNGDGYSDILVGAPNAKSLNGKEKKAGRVYVVLGVDILLPSTAIQLNSAIQAVTISTSAERHYLGYSVTGGFDLNRDGYDDFCLGAPEAKPGATSPFQGPGKTYCFFGFSGFSSSTAVVTAEDVDGQNGFIVVGKKSGSQCGGALSGGVDINGDSKDDLIVGGHYANYNGYKHVGQAYVIYGSDSAFPKKIKLKKGSPHFHAVGEVVLICAIIFPLLGTLAVSIFAFKYWRRRDLAKHGADALLPHAAVASPMYPPVASTGTSSYAPQEAIVVPVQTAQIVQKQQQVAVIIPPDSLPGQVMQINVNGTIVQFVVPQGCLPGTQLMIAV